MTCPCSRAATLARPCRASWRDRFSRQGLIWMHFVAPANAGLTCRSLNLPQQLSRVLGKEPVPGTHSSCHAQEHGSDTPTRGTSDNDFFFPSLLQMAPKRRVPLIKHRRHCPCLLLKIDWAGTKWGEQSWESKARRAKPGEKSWESKAGKPPPLLHEDAVHGAGHAWVRRKETLIIPLWKTALGGTSGLHPVPRRGAEERGTRAVQAASCGFASAAALIYF